MNDESDPMNAAVGRPAHETNETLRKFLHIGFGLFAVALAWLNWRIAAAIALAAALGNWVFLHRIVGKRVARHDRGYDAGLVLYPLAVAALIVIFNRHLEIAAVCWVILAFGDGLATIAGKAGPRAPLPWNAGKSWTGMVAFIVVSIPAAWLVTRFFAGTPLVAVAIAALCAAVVETLPLGINDNLTVPFAAAATLATLGIDPLVPFVTHPPIGWPWMIANTVLAILGYAFRAVDASGSVVGWLLGSVVIVGGGPALYVALLAFFVVGSLLTRLGYRSKQRAGLAQEEGGRRGAAHAIANVGIAALCAVACWRGLGLVPLFMGIAALATAAADTAGSEVGQLIGRRAFLPLTFRRVERGTEGAISIEGTVAGMLAALAVAVAGVAMAVHQLRPGFVGRVVIDKLHAITVITLCGVLGSYLESVICTVSPDTPSHVRNFVNTAIGAFLFWVAWHYIPMFGFEF